MIKFSSEQKYALELGAGKRQRLTSDIAKRLQITKRDPRLGEKIDSLYYGTTGIGKTHNVLKAMDELGVNYDVIQGNISMYAMGGKLMTYHHHLPKGQKMVIVFDDCDSFFETKENINILKMMTSTNISMRKFQYNKKTNVGDFTEEQQQYIENYLHTGSHGYTVPTENFIFLFTTNFPLPTEPEANELARTKPGSTAANRALDLSAIRGRVQTQGYILNKNENWGWIAEVALNDGLLDMLEYEQKIILLDWMWNNWDRLKERNLRTLPQMAYEMLDNPENYRDNWEYDYLQQ